jgi:hypothetical protein
MYAQATHCRRRITLWEHDPRDALSPVEKRKLEAKQERAAAGEAAARRHAAANNSDANLNTDDLQLGDARAWKAGISGTAGDYIGASGIQVDSLISKDGENVGEWLAKKNAAAKRTWGTVRQAAREGHFLANVAARVQQASAPMTYSVSLGGWQPADRWTPPSPVGNLNLKQTTAAAPAEPTNAFSSRLFSSRAPAEEAFAGRGVYGIMMHGDDARAQPPMQQNYSRVDHLCAPRPTAPPQMAPGTKVPLKGGWPTGQAYGEAPSEPHHVGGWSIEKTSHTLHKRTDHQLFHRVSPSS